MRGAAETDPIGFVDNLPGRFLLTGSSHVLLIPKLSDSLAGRMAILRLHPFAQCELAGQHPEFLDRLFAADFPIKQVARLKDELATRISSGGYPPALARPEGRRRENWYRDYITTLVQRDVREITRVRSLDALPRLLRLAAARTAQLLNLSDLASAFQLSRVTIGDYVTLLENIFLLERLPAWQ